LGVGAVSYAGAFTIGVTADRDAFPDLDGFVTGMEQELEALRTTRPKAAASRFWMDPRNKIDSNSPTTSAMTSRGSQVSTGG
jgi:hypothetical protein